jgi:hypothetical protein
MGVMSPVAAMNFSKCGFHLAHTGYPKCRPMAHEKDALPASRQAGREARRTRRTPEETTGGAQRGGIAVLQPTGACGDSCIPERLGALVMRLASCCARNPHSSEP